MIRFECDKGNCLVEAKGDLFEIGADMCVFVKKIREGVREQGDEKLSEVFDSFLKEKLVDMALGDPEEMLIDAIIDKVSDSVVEKLKKDKGEECKEGE